MSQLSTAAEDYLALRRSLGYKLANQGRLLVDFVSYMDSIPSSRVTVDAVLAWATRPEDADPTWLYARFSAVRGFAVFLKNRDPATEVPEPGLLPDGKHRRIPKSTPRTRSSGCWPPPGGCRRRCAQRPTAPCSG